ncbi:MAG: energy-coupling factor transporter transmembrane protein EcfT, partial [Treponema sp.]|nr:energy-coupling factor transporter transmembrane protein EcfT [Treponema sp.]
LRAAGVFLRAAAVFLRIAAFAALLSLYSAVTPLRETLGALKDFFTLFAPLGFPAGDLSLAAGITLRFVPVFAEEAERIVCARLSRGGRGGKTGMIFSMALPLFLRVLERSETLVSAMTLRLYRRG